MISELKIITLRLIIVGIIFVKIHMKIFKIKDYQTDLSKKISSTTKKQDFFFRRKIQGRSYIYQNSKPKIHFDYVTEINFPNWNEYSDNIKFIIEIILSEAIEEVVD